MYKCFAKRLLDIVCAGLAMAVFSPLFIVLIIVGMVEMKGNPFFVQLRSGYQGRIFKLIKFRTMTNERDDRGMLLLDKLRLNKYGKFLRSTSLDELPEAINILLGDMSVVGPRPLLVEYLDYYNSHDIRRQEVRPGLTGLAQVSGRNTVSWKQKFQLDVEYVDKLTFLLDVKIIVMTVIKTVSREGIEFEDNHQPIREYFRENP